MILPPLRRPRKQIQYAHRCDTCLQGLHGLDKNHTRDIYRCNVRDRIRKFARFQFVMNRASSKRLYMSWTSFPPNTRFMRFCLMASPRLARRGLPVECLCLKRVGQWQGRTGFESPRAKLGIFFESKEKRMKNFQNNVNFVCKE